MVFCLIALAYIMFIFGLFKKLIKCIGKGCEKFGIGGEGEKEYFINEGLGSYFECMDSWTRKSMYIEEVRMRLKLHLKTFSDHAIK